MNECQRVDGPFVEQIARDNYEIHTARDGLVYNMPESTAEIVEALTHAILFVAQVCISNVNKGCSHDRLVPLISCILLPADGGIWPRHPTANAGGNQDQCCDTEDQHIAARILAAGRVGQRHRNGKGDNGPIYIVLVVEATAAAGLLAQCYQRQAQRTLQQAEYSGND